MAARSVQPAAAAKLASLLEECQVKGSPLRGDGTHLNSVGIVKAAPLVQELAADFNADAVLSDSCLCGTEECEEPDWWAEDMEKLTGLHIEASWGYGFEGSKKFQKTVYKAWRKNPQARKMILLFAGNDISMGRSGAAVATEMERLQKYWAEVDLELTYIDVVPVCDRGQ